MRKEEITATVRTISSRSVPGGGFSEQLGAPFRVDSTAWAILALRADGTTHSNLVGSARSRLASEQFSDGRISLAQDQPQTCWPTAMAVMAWSGDATFNDNSKRAVTFLIKTGGMTLKRKSDAPYGHDTSIQGWTWIENTFSWVEPTTLALLALSLVGYTKHARVSEGVRLLMDRQLPSGGWNYGGTIVYGQELYPQPENTGMALTALAGQVEKKEIQRSLDYLKSQVVSCRTPLSLGWAIFGLGAWGQRPTEAEKWIIESISMQRKYGPYGTTLLSLLVLAYLSNGSFLETIA